MVAEAMRIPLKGDESGEELGGELTFNADALAADYTFLGVKPAGLEDLFEELRPALAEAERPPVLVSMAAVTSIDRILALAGREVPVIRIMPNTPVAVGRGVILYACSPLVTKAQEAIFLEAMSEGGRFRSRTTWRPARRWHWRRTGRASPSPRPCATWATPWPTG